MFISRYIKYKINVFFNINYFIQGNILNFTLKYVELNKIIYFIYLRALKIVSTS